MSGGIRRDLLPENLCMEELSQRINSYDIYDFYYESFKKGLLFIFKL